MKRFGQSFAAISAFLILLTVGAAAQTSWPTKTVTVVVPVAAGGPLDTVARLMAEEMKIGLSQSIVVENRPGAAAQLGSEYVVRSEPDGHTLLVVGASQAILPHLYPNMRYDPEKDLAPITLIAKGAYGLMVPASSPASNVRELIEMFKKEPGKYNYASSGIGGPPHLATEVFKMETGVDIVHVPYTGTGPALQDLLAGRVSMFLDVLGPSLGMISTGKLKLLGVATRERLSFFPAVPTLSEQGVKDFEASSWIGLYAPGATPKPIVDAIYKVASSALQSEKVSGRLKDLSLEVVVSTPDGLRDFQAAETKKNGEAVRRANIKVQQK